MIAIAVGCTLLLGACSSGPDFENSFSLVDEQGNQVQFPESYRGRKLVLSFIYTHCPDVCLATTARMIELRDRLGEENDAMFLSITLDPRRDSSSVLREYARIQGIDTRNWHLLTGDKETLDSLFERMDVFYRTSFMQHGDDGTEVYFLDHSDIIAVMDSEGVVQAEFKGTELDPDEVAEVIDEIS